MSRRRCEAAQILEHDLRVCSGVADLVDAGDDPVWVDQERDALGVVRVGLVGTALDAVLVTDLSIDVGQQAKAELFVRRERLVVCGCVERGSDDRRAEFGELWASITEALAFARSTAGRRFGIPPQNDPRAAQVAEADDALVLVGQREVGGSIAKRKHDGILTVMASRCVVLLRQSNNDGVRGA